MHLDHSGYTPLCFYNWSHESTADAIARNREGVARFGRILQKNRAPIENYAERARLKIDWADPSSTLSPLAGITQVRGLLTLKALIGRLSSITPVPSTMAWVEPR